MTASPPPVEASVLSVSGLNRLVRSCLEANFSLTWVAGEISNLTYAASGHVYFSLKDASAQARCVMWRSRAQLLGWRLENGQKIETRALVSFYEPRGEFQLTVEAIRRAGQGDLYEQFLRLKAQLEAEGFFAAAGKRPLPAFPRRIAIVTSPQAAALRDVLSTLRRRAPHIAIDFYPTPVQGEGAGQRIAAAIQAASAGESDLILLCRGGGSIEDLQAFNEEGVARAIRAAGLPVIAGIGHETDFTIADFAADLRAPTPTAAAELAAPDRMALCQGLAKLHEQLRRHTERALADRQQRLDWLAGRLLHPAERLAQRRDHLLALQQRLGQSLRRCNDGGRRQLQAAGHRLQAARPRLAQRGEALGQLRQRLERQLQWQFAQRRTELNALASGLRQLDPRAVLARGYTLATGPDGRAVRDVGELAAGAVLRLDFARGAALATVDRVVAGGEAD
ncbi:MAG: exodeoxyribonuclease VII large subunit [Azonexus sp.]|jgi:exodeoxyribonuclease VII large subunit|uniref:exodeoxyribonuclease VII large subunit n=1 Tax=Azonexus sp. TaxID=1872668 RepID=UPI00282A8BCC|nr:exodeoxyribonuclease VII large subunit [Azonexus sp.]MDR0776478.1 exodeoxyribonuclease VII large subunit [Azonexus sp.]